MRDAVEYYVFRSSDNTWLQDDEHTWKADFGTAAAFTDAQLAEDIRLRETKGDETATYVLGWFQ